MLTLEEFNRIPPGSFRFGVCPDNESGLNMTGSGRPLKWVAVKGYAEDWCIYTHLDGYTYDFVKSDGDKVMGEDNIMNVLPCDNFVFARYRY
jgi:hypothetical protein